MCEVVAGDRHRNHIEVPPVKWWTDRMGLSPSVDRVHLRRLKKERGRSYARARRVARGLL